MICPSEHFKPVLNGLEVSQADHRAGASSPGVGPRAQGWPWHRAPPSADISAANGWTCCGKRALPVSPGGPRNAAAFLSLPLGCLPPRCTASHSQDVGSQRERGGDVPARASCCFLLNLVQTPRLPGWPEDKAQPSSPTWRLSISDGLLLTAAFPSDTEHSWQPSRLRNLCWRGRDTSFTGTNAVRPEARKRRQCRKRRRQAGGTRVFKGGDTDSVNSADKRQGADRLETPPESRDGHAGHPNCAFSALAPLLPAALVRRVTFPLKDFLGHHCPSFLPLPLCLSLAGPPNFSTPGFGLCSFLVPNSSPGDLIQCHQRVSVQGTE